MVPLIIFGDFNIDVNDLVNSGWLGVPKFVPIWPKRVTSTLYNTSNRIIDYILVSKSIQSIIGRLLPDLSFMLEVLNRPMVLQSDFLVKPRPLPTDLAKGVYKSNSESVNGSIWEYSRKQAAAKLEKARAKTGTAILGKPSQASLSDPKFQGEYLSDSIKSGEAVAFATLSSEHYVLWLAGVKSSEHYMHTGRSQFPKIVQRPITPLPLKKIGAALLN